MARLRIFTDGGARGNPGPSACAFVVLDDQNKLIFQQGFYLGYGTNNQAEYLGVVKALEWLGPRSAIFYLDSLLVVKQIKGEYKIKDPKKVEIISCQIPSPNLVKEEPFDVVIHLAGIDPPSFAETLYLTS